jgi:hypothetical protein
MESRVYNHQGVAVLSQQLYNKRFNEHISHAKILNQNGDYVQAGEKVWGALSALVNARSPVEFKSPNDKKAFFVGLLNQYLQHNPVPKQQMRQLGFRNSTDVFYAAYGLHKFFYGGTLYTDKTLSTRIPFLIGVIENLLNI